MSNIIKLKNSGTASATPSYLEYGELALNYNDEKIFYKNSLDEIIEFDLSGAGTGGSITVEGTVFASTLGNGVDSQFVINHNLGTRDVVVSVREQVSPYSSLLVAWEATTEDSITLYFDSPPDLNSARATVYVAVAGIAQPSLEGTVFNTTIGNDVDDQFVISHNFNSRDVTVSIRETNSPYGLIITQWEATTEDSITVYFESPPTFNSVRVSIYIAVAGAPSTSLGGLSDVAITSLATNEVLQYDGSNWVNQAFAGGITSITAGTGLSGGTITTSGTISIDNTVVTLTGTQTLENKTLTSPVISSIVNTGTLTLPTSTDTLVGRSTTDTLTNKTLTSPVISSIVNTGTLTLPTSTDTLVGRSTTDTLTNKTLTSPVINTPDIILSTSSSTTDARIFWDSTNKKIKVGNGSISLDFVSSNIIQNQQIASYTLVLTDKDKMVEMSVGSANNLTVPPESSVNFPVGSQITILQTNTGQTTIVAGAGVTVNATPGLKLRARWSSVTLIKRAADTWVALGDLQA